jgi:hypothetical protein
MNLLWPLTHTVHLFSLSARANNLVVLFSDPMMLILVKDDAVRCFFVGWEVEDARILTVANLQPLNYCHNYGGPT